MSELKPNDPLVKEMLNDHLLVLVTKEAWILLNESRRIRPDLKAELVENRTIYDAASKLDERVRQAAPNLVVALKNLLDAVEERQALADSIESKVLSEARILVENLKVNTIMGDTE